MYTVHVHVHYDTPFHSKSSSNDKELFIYLAASDVAPMATTILLLVADMPTEILALLS